MKSKAHYKKCKELGLNPLPPLDGLDDGMDDDGEGESLTSGDHTSTMPGDETDSDDDSDDGCGGYSSGMLGKTRLLRMQCAILISLSFALSQIMTSPVCPNTRPPNRCCSSPKRRPVTPADNRL